MADNPITSVIETRAVIKVNARLIKRLLSALLVCFVFLLFGCATAPMGTVQTHVLQTLRGSPVKITRISLPFSHYANVQSGAGFVWTKISSVSGQKTIRIDPSSNQLTELSRPWNERPEFLVTENSIWSSDGSALFRVDIETNQVITKIENVGIPFSIGDGAVWTYNHQTQAVTGIDTKTNLIRAQLVTQGRPYHPGSFAFGAGSIWQFAYEGNVSWWQANGMDVSALPSVVRRIDPYTKKVIAEIPLGLFTRATDPYVSSNRLHFVAGAIWVLGKSAEETIWNPGHIVPFAKRIDVKTNLVTATIPLKSNFVTALEGGLVSCNEYSTPKTPVFWNGGIWISMYCSALPKSALLKIDLQTNQIVEEVILKLHQPDLTAAYGSLWGFGGDSAIRVDL